MEHNIQKNCFIITIPEEIRGKIYNKLPQNQALELRLVCKQFKREIDEYFKFSIELDDRKSKPEELSQLMDLRVEKCKILSFINSPDSTTESPENNSAILFLRYPKFLKNLEILDGQISPHYFHSLMQECSQYLEKLKISLTDSSTLWKLKNVFSSGSQYYRHNFQNLCNLCLIDNRSLENYKDPELEQRFAVNNDIFLNILENASFVKLHSLDIRFISHFGIDHTIALKFTTAILSLVAKQFKNLKNLVIYCYVAKDRNWKTKDLNPSDLQRIDMDLLKKVIHLQEIDLVIDGCISPAALNLWLDLLDRQKQLEKLRFKVTQPLYPLMQRIANNNASSLCSVSIKFNMSDNNDLNIVPFDLSTFQDCQNLKMLYLDGDFRTRVDVVNFQLLPTSIQKLHIFAMGILTPEIDLWFSQDLNCLKDLHFSECGTEGRGFGVSFTTLERILNLSNLSKIKLYESVCSINIEEGIFMRVHEYPPTVCEIFGDDFSHLRNIRLERDILDDHLVKF